MGSLAPEEVLHTLKRLLHERGFLGLELWSGGGGGGAGGEVTWEGGGRGRAPLLPRDDHRGLFINNVGLVVVPAPARTRT